MIADAMRAAQTEYVVYFLLTAYLEARVHDRILHGPDAMTRLPVRSEAEVDERLLILQHVLLERTTPHASRLPGLREAAEVFSAAKERLVALRGELSLVY